MRMGQNEKRKKQFVDYFFKLWFIPLDIENRYYDTDISMT